MLDINSFTTSIKNRSWDGCIIGTNLICPLIAAAAAIYNHLSASATVQGTPGRYERSVLGFSLEGNHWPCRPL